MSPTCLYIVQKVQKTKKKQVCPNVDWWCMSFNFEPGLWGSLGKSFNRLLATTLWNTYQVTITLLNFSFLKKKKLSPFTTVESNTFMSWDRSRSTILCHCCGMKENSSQGLQHWRQQSKNHFILLLLSLCLHELWLNFFFFQMHTPCLEAND